MTGEAASPRANTDGDGQAKAGQQEREARITGGVLSDLLTRAAQWWPRFRLLLTPSTSHRRRKNTQSNHCEQEPGWHQ